MRSGYKGLNRYRMDICDIKKLEETVKNLNINKIFLISGEDPKFDFKDIITMVEYGKDLGLYVSLAAGEFSLDKYLALEDAGLDEYVLKFETSNKDMLTR
jgi:biotin synthase